MDLADCKQLPVDKLVVNDSSFMNAFASSFLDFDKIGLKDKVGSLRRADFPNVGRVRVCFITGGFLVNSIVFGRGIDCRAESCEPECSLLLSDDPASVWCVVDKLEDVVGRRLLQK